MRAGNRKAIILDARWDFAFVAGTSGLAGSTTFGHERESTSSGRRIFRFLSAPRWQ